MAETTIIKKFYCIKFKCKNEGCEFESTNPNQRLAHERILGHIDYDCLEVPEL